MIKIESLKNYLGNITEEEVMELATKIYTTTNFICNDYPKYKEWYFTKQLPETINSEKRNILFARNPENNTEIVAIACLKKYQEERKICTLYVAYEYRNLGIGKAIVEESMKWLNTTKPFITFADYKLEIFRPIIDKYDWKLTEIVSGLYRKESQELCFNGTLTKNNDNSLEQQLQNKLIRVLKNRCKQIQ